jgi:uncharacterized cupin superfamily protein
MATMIKGSFSKPNEIRTPPQTRVEMVNLGDVKAARFTMQPGWRWSECVGPVVGTESCQVHHVGAVISGSMGVRHNDGTDIVISAGDAYVIEPGHDAWVLGDAPYVCHEFDQQAAADFGRSTKASG